MRGLIITANMLIIDFNTRNRALFFATMEAIELYRRGIIDISILVIELYSLQLLLFIGALVAAAIFQYS